MINTYLQILNFVILSFFLGFILLTVSLILRLRTRIDREKSSIYECGFIPFSETRFQFEIQFYAIAILFLLFDIEVLYLYPYSINYQITDNLQGIYLFLMALVLGLLYELNSDIIKFFKKSHENPL